MRIHIVTADVQDKDRYRDYRPSHRKSILICQLFARIRKSSMASSSASWVFTVRVTGQNIAWVNLFAKASLFSRSSNALWTRTVGNT